MHCSAVKVPYWYNFTLQTLPCFLTRKKTNAIFLTQALATQRALFSFFKFCSIAAQVSPMQNIVAIPYVLRNISYAIKLSTAHQAAHLKGTRCYYDKHELTFLPSRSLSIGCKTLKKKSNVSIMGTFRTLGKVDSGAAIASEHSPPALTADSAERNMRARKSDLVIILTVCVCVKCGWVCVGVR